MTYNLKVKDLINISENKSSFNIDDMIHICKRENNNKRDYLFVNKYLGKHYPVSANKVLKLFNELYLEILKSNLQNKKILVIGFAETATALSEFITHQSIIREDLNIVYHLQTTREYINTTINNIAFQEEHSHATNQKLYWNEKVIPEYDTILFVEDEITTGKTIINFIEKFKELKNNTNFYVASILNWQNQENINKYKDLNINTICLVKGQLKNDIPKIEVVKTNKKDFFTTNKKIFKKTLSDSLNPRTGLPKKEFLEYINLQSDLDINSLKDDSTVIGTEEFMYKAILLADKLNATVRSTTRSPIITSIEDEYLIENGISIPSFYDSNRKTFLYNTRHDETKNIIFLTEEKCNKWENIIKNIFSDKVVLFLSTK